MDGNKITLVPERETWKPGESAKRDDSVAMGTRDRAAHRRARGRAAIPAGRHLVDAGHGRCADHGGDVPNVFVSVLLVKGRTADALAPDGTDAGQPAFRVGYTTLTIDDESKRLNVTVSSDHDEYLPHAPAKVSVAVRDMSGKPASAEIALWAVDYGLLSLTNYTTPDIVKAIYSRRDLQVLTEDTRERMISRRVLVKDDGGADRGGAGGGRGGGRRRTGWPVGLWRVLQREWNLEGGSITDLASNSSPSYFNFDRSKRSRAPAPRSPSARTSVPSSSGLAR